MIEDFIRAVTIMFNNLIFPVLIWLVIGDELNGIGISFTEILASYYIVLILFVHSVLFIKRKLVEVSIDKLIDQVEELK